MLKMQCRGNTNPRLKYKYLLIDVDYVVNDCLASYPIITQSRICDEYANQFSGNNLLEELSGLNLDLTSLVEHAFGKMIRVVPDPVEPIFIRYSQIDKSVSALPLAGLDVGQSLKAIESVPIVTEVGPSPAQSVGNLSAGAENLFDKSATEADVQRTLAAELDAVDLNVLSAVTEKNDETKVFDHHHHNDHDDDRYAGAEEFGDVPPPPGFESVVHQRATVPLLPPLRECDDWEAKVNEKLIEVVETAKQPVAEVVTEPVRPPLFDLTEFVDAGDEVKKAVNNNEDKENDENDKGAAATTDHFYDSDFDNEPTDENVVEPYRIVNNCVVNYAKARTQRDELVAKVRSQLVAPSTGDSWAEKIIDLPAVFALLRRLHELHPDGCSAEQLCQFEETLFADGSNFTLATTVPSTAALLGVGLLYVDRDGRFRVATDVPKVRPQQLKRNFTSNLYRILHTHDGQLPMRKLIPLLPLLVPRSVNLNAECVIRVCNRIPLIFQLEFRTEDNYNLDNAYVCLTRAVPDWMVQFDCDHNDVDGMLCDCQKCCPKCSTGLKKNSGGISSRQTRTAVV